MTLDKERAFALVRSIPKGQVAAFGQIAKLAEKEAQSHGRAVRMMLCGDRDWEKSDTRRSRPVTFFAATCVQSRMAADIHGPQSRRREEREKTVLRQRGRRRGRPSYGAPGFGRLETAPAGHLTSQWAFPSIPT